MYVDRKATLLAVAMAGASVLSTAVAVSLVFVFDPEFLLATTGLPYFDAWTWDYVVLWAGEILTLGMLLVAPVGAFSLAVPEDRDVGPVVAGFVVGAVVLGAGVLAVAWAASLPATVYARIGMLLALLFGGTASLGAFGGDTVGPLFRSPDGSDHLR